MNLLVFKHERRFVVLVSSRHLGYSSRLFIELVEFDDPSIDTEMDDNVLVRVRFKDEIYLVPFLLTQSIRVDADFLARPIGALAEEDSRNILNHLQDFLDWD